MPLLSSLKAWEEVRICVLARPWHHLWEDVPCVNLRLGGEHEDTPDDPARFTCHLFCHRGASMDVDTLAGSCQLVDFLAELMLADQY
jgi:hypothetical protein